MIDRIPEPEAMDTPEEAIFYDAMDHESVNTAFVDEFLVLHGPCRGELIVDLGTGTARIPIALCRREPQARVLALDIATHMIAQARTNVEQAGFSDRIELRVADAKALDLEPESSEALISNSILHHVSDPDAVLSQMVQVVEPGGTLFIRDLYRPNSVEEIERLVERHAGRETLEARDMFRASLFASYTLEEVRGMINRLGLDGGKVVLTSDRHWTWAWKRPE